MIEALLQNGRRFVMPRGCSQYDGAISIPIPVQVQVPDTMDVPKLPAYVGEQKQEAIADEASSSEGHWKRKL